jgi:hypothetical protein
MDKKTHTHTLARTLAQTERSLLTILSSIYYNERNVLRPHAYKYTYIYIYIYMHNIYL